jgi:hypothetical protein
LVVQAWLGSRLVLYVAALWFALTTGRTADDLFANWDVQHFYRIAREGYVVANDVAFFPGWPLLLRGLAAVGLPMLVSGIALALLGSALAAWALFRLGGALPAVAWLLAPTTVFTLVPYTESLFCAAAFWAWQRASIGRWPQAAGLAALACTLRISGLFLVAALIVLALTGDRSAGLRARLASLAWLVLPLATIGGYVLYLFLTTGSWSAWYDAQAAGWSRGFTWPWEALQHTLEAASSGAYPEYPEWSWVFRAELLSMAIGALVTVACLARRRWAEATWVGLQVLAFATSYWFISVNRAVLLWFPLFLLLGDVFGSRWWEATPARRGGRTVLAVLLLAAATSAIWSWCWLFYTGRWAG